MLFNPYTTVMATSHTVPEMSNMPEAFDNPSMYHGMLFPPSRYDSKLRDARRLRQKPIKISTPRYRMMMDRSIGESIVLMNKWICY